MGLGVRLFPVFLKRKFGYLKYLAVELAVCFHKVNAVFEPRLGCFFGLNLKGKGHILTNGSRGRTQGESVNSHTVGICKSKYGRHFPNAIFKKRQATMPYNPISTIIFRTNPVQFL